MKKSRHCHPILFIATIFSLQSFALGRGLFFSADADETTHIIPTETDSMHCKNTNIQKIQNIVSRSLYSERVRQIVHDACLLIFS